MTKGPAEIAHGPMLVGLCLNVLLYGIMITQTYIYFTTYQRDRLWMKLFVALLFIADTANTIFILIYVYTSVIIHFGEISYLQKADWIFATDPAITAIIATLTQLFFGWRVKVLTNNFTFFALIAICSVAGGVGGILTAYEVGITPQFTEFRTFKSVVILWLTAECIGDILITSNLVWHLRKHKTGFRPSDELIDRIIRLTVQTGLITALCAVIDLVLYLVDPTGTHLIFNFPLSKLYTNSLMSSLNSRVNNSSSIQRTPLPGSAPQMLPYDQRKTGDAIQFQERPELFIQVESHEMNDMNLCNGSLRVQSLDKVDAGDRKYSSV